METAIWNAFNTLGDDEFAFVGISNTNNTSVINSFVEEGGLTFPILYDPGSSGGVQGGDTYDMYYMPNDGSPYPRDFIIDQQGVIAYANNEIDTEWMIYVINELSGFNNGVLGDLNEDSIVNILDIVSIINIILGQLNPSEYQLWASDLNQDQITNILDVVMLVNLILN
tara:strand:+ start:190 stop:696 length:507 start_codon:yes stop_codon:yes gene_type:complete